ncbi:MAG: hypothetical protein GWP61_26635 [Chloroflexi bacterium]|jgi:hypothetical protein|nr:hypothetical protein [Chloroflexota bacterium]
MVHKRSVIAGILLGLLILAFGLALIFAKDWVWSLFEIFYSMLGIQAERGPYWGMFITTIGLGVSAIGLFTIWTVWRRWRNGK